MAMRPWYRTLLGALTACLMMLLVGCTPDVVVLPTRVPMASDRPYTLFERLEVEPDSEYELNRILREQKYLSTEDPDPIEATPNNLERQWLTPGQMLHVSISDSMQFSAGRPRESHPLTSPSVRVYSFPIRFVYADDRLSLQERAFLMTLLVSQFGDHLQGDDLSYSFGRDISEKAQLRDHLLSIRSSLWNLVWSPGSGGGAFASDRPQPIRKLKGPRTTWVDCRIFRALHDSGLETQDWLHTRRVFYGGSGPTSDHLAEWLGVESKRAHGWKKINGAFRRDPLSASPVRGASPVPSIQFRVGPRVGWDWNARAEEVWSLADWEASRVLPGCIQPEIRAIRFRHSDAIGKTIVVQIAWPGDTRAPNAVLESDLDSGMVKLKLSGRSQPVMSYEELTRYDPVAFQNLITEVFLTDGRLMLVDSEGIEEDALDLKWNPIKKGFILPKRAVWWARCQHGTGRAFWVKKESISSVAAYANSILAWERFRIWSPEVKHRITMLEIPSLGRACVVDDDASASYTVTTRAGAVIFERKPNHKGSPSIARSDLAKLSAFGIKAVHGLTQKPLPGIPYGDGR